MIARATVPTRVLMTADTIGGVWTYALELARALGAEGMAVTLATMGNPPSAAQSRAAADIATLDLIESRYRLPWMENPWGDVTAARHWLKELTVEVSPSIVHLNEPACGVGAWPVPTVAVAHSCVLSWWQAVWNEPAPDSWSRYAEEMRRGFAGVDEVVAPSRWMLQAVRRYYGVKGGRVITNGRSAEQFRTGPKDAVIFAAGRLWDSAKNLLALDAVAAELSWKVYLAGDISHPDRETSIRTDHLHLLGKLPADIIADWLARASIYAFPARYEPFGLSVLEAALSQCTLVLGDLPTLRELWDGAAVFVPPDDADGLRLTLQELIEDPCLRQLLAVRAHRRALELTPRRMARAYLELYAGLLAPSAAGQESPACA